MNSAHRKQLSTAIEPVRLSGGKVNEVEF